MRSLPALPQGISCPDWEHDGSENPKRCRYYVAEGGCQTDLHLVCVEWEKRKQTNAKASSTLPITPLPLPPDAPQPLADVLALPLPVRAEVPKEAETFRLEPTAPPPKAISALPGTIPAATPLAPSGKKTKPKAGAAARARAAWEALTAGDSPATLDDSSPYAPPLAAIDPNDLARLEALADEIHIHSETVGPLVLVREHSKTPRPEVELTYREAAFLRLIVDAFPGARVTKVTPPKTGGEAAAKDEERVPAYLPPHITPRKLAPGGGVERELELDPFALETEEEEPIASVLEDPFALDGADAADADAFALDGAEGAGRTGGSP